MTNDENKFYADIGALVKAKRLERGYTLDDVLIPETSRSSISSFENGKQKLGAYQLMAIASFLGVELPKVNPPESLIKRAKTKDEINRLNASL